MTLFKNLQLIEPYFYSIRKHKEFFILDVSIPNTWGYKREVTPYSDSIKVKHNGEENGMSFVSFYTQYSEEGVDAAVNCVMDVIRLNQEREEKERLLQVKMNELKMQFESTDLDRLKSLHFEYSEPTVAIDTDSVVFNEEKVEEDESEDGEHEGFGAVREHEA